jgi:hypothetical protein
LAAACLVVGPLAGASIEAFDPASKPTESTARLVADAARHPARTRAVLIADAFLWLMVPAALVAVRLAWRRAPALSLVAGVFSLTGWVAPLPRLPAAVEVAAYRISLEALTNAADTHMPATARFDSR